MSATAYIQKFTSVTTSRSEVAPNGGQRLLVATHSKTVPRRERERPKLTLKLKHTKTKANTKVKLKLKLKLQDED
jgi:hypothetical protein